MEIEQLVFSGYFETHLLLNNKIAESKRVLNRITKSLEFHNNFYFVGFKIFLAIQKVRPFHVLSIKFYDQIVL